VSLKSLVQNLFHKNAAIPSTPAGPAAPAPKPLDLNTSTAEEIDMWIMAFGSELRRLRMEIDEGEHKPGGPDPVVPLLRKRLTELESRRDLARARLTELRAAR
jgi:hypothetical protein